MKNTIAYLLVLACATALLGREDFTNVWFELTIEGNDYVCTSTIVSGDGVADYFGPILLFPVELKDDCTAGHVGDSVLITPNGTSQIPAPRDRWFVVFRKLHISASPGTLILITQEHDHFLFSTVPISIAPRDGTVKLRLLLESALMVKSSGNDRQSAEPGATDNPDSAGFQAEKSSSN